MFYNMLQVNTFGQSIVHVEISFLLTFPGSSVLFSMIIQLSPYKVFFFKIIVIVICTSSVHTVWFCLAPNAYFPFISLLIILNIQYSLVPWRFSTCCLFGIDSDDDVRVVQQSTAAKSVCCACVRAWLPLLGLLGTYVFRSCILSNYLVCWIVAYKSFEVVKWWYSYCRLASLHDYCHWVKT